MQLGVILTGLALITGALLVDPGFAQLNRMRLSLAYRFEGRLSVFQFFDLRHLIIGVVNQSAAMPTIARDTNSDSVNGIIFVLGHTSTFQKGKFSQTQLP